ncbi:phenylacetate--CoA ligase family protein [Desulfoscipio gibsoniae]|uniref:Coenzyme F390 synthetase n=1 Tax=Desulfoscipio gibsoniae DSM 7213 TaxID=767817 RepID=R4KIA2_9FIRM|nr:AMP-binding protein [Desulfoscipio gibsoniae]AGL02344.1 coenzyme F390 synthetase [Desulfoscipio gibsoniae DSM 7213]
MIAGITDRAMRWFENYNCLPGIVNKTAGFVVKHINSGNNRRVIRKIQLRRLRSTVQYVAVHSPFYREMFKRLGVRPGDIRTVENLQELPFTTDDDIRNWRKFLCVPQDRLAAIFATSGTTGEPKRVYFSYREMQMFTNLYALTARMGHAGRVVGFIALPTRHGLWIGSAIAHRAVERAGGLPIPAGADNTVETIQWMKRFEPNIIFSSPSYMTALTRKAEQEGYRLEIDKVLTGGELLTEEHKKYFHEYWKAQVYDSYGSTEIGGALTIALPGCCAFHFNDLHLLTEIIDPVTGKPAEEGELVFTTLRREAMPLLRYRSGDRARWVECGCGLPFVAAKVLGRTDKMMVVGDMNLYGRVILEAISKISGATGRIAIKLLKSGMTDKMVLRVEGDVGAQDVRLALLEAYSEMETNIANGNLILEIETGADLGSQIKAIKILDDRNIYFQQ